LCAVAGTDGTPLAYKARVLPARPVPHAGALAYQRIGAYSMPRHVPRGGQEHSPLKDMVHACPTIRSGPSGERTPSNPS
jgi:hypothetical protein